MRCGDDPFLPHGIQVVANAVAHRLQQGAVDVAAGVAEREAGDDAPRVRVVERGALAGKVGQHEQAVVRPAARRGQLRQRRIGVGAAGCLGRQLRLAQLSRNQRVRLPAVDMPPATA